MFFISGFCSAYAEFCFRNLAGIVLSRLQIAMSDEVRKS
jgi:hypothetical protein